MDFLINVCSVYPNTNQLISGSIPERSPLNIFYKSLHMWTCKDNTSDWVNGKLQTFGTKMRKYVRYAIDRMQIGMVQEYEKNKSIKIMN